MAGKPVQQRPRTLTEATSAGGQAAADDWARTVDVVGNDRR